MTKSLSKCALILGLLGTAAAAERIDRDVIRRDLDIANTSFAEEEKWFQPRREFASPDLLVGEFLYPSDLRAAATFANILGKRTPFKVWLITMVDGQPSPAFNGLLLDGANRPVANLKVSEVRTEFSHDVASWGERCIDKIDRYYCSTRPWTEYILKMVRESVGIDRDDDRFGEIDLPRAQYAEYRERVARTRQMMRFFDVGGSRPAWLLIRSRWHDIDSRGVEQLQDQVSQSPVVTTALVARLGELVKLEAGGVERIEIERCETTLAPAMAERFLKR